jgi:formamidopyrimidine-DNA glycosylase
MDLIASDGLTQHPWFAGLGPEPLGVAFDAKYLAEVLRGRRQGIKTLLLDQRIVAGLGNIYVCEALHRSGISPLRPGGAISGRELKALVSTIRLVLEEAIEAGGSTLRDYAGADGALGYFQHRFRAYDREGEPCTRAGCRGVIERTVQSGRSTFFCAACQR